MIRNICTLTLFLSMAYGECIVTGCSNQICAEEPISSNCEYLDWYACLQYSECGNYGFEGNCIWLTTDSFLDCLDSFGVTIGCTDPEACNYDEEANVDDGSCEYIDDCGICGGSCDFGTTLQSTAQALAKIIISATQEAKPTVTPVPPNLRGCSIMVT